MTDQNIVGEEIKEEKSKLKKENSYTYWVNKNPNYFKDAKIDIKPKSLDANEIHKLKKYEFQITISLIITSDNRSRKTKKMINQPGILLEHGKRYIFYE